MGAVVLRAGLVGGTTTVAAARLLCHLVAEMPPSDAKAVLADFGAVDVSTSTPDRLARRVGDAWEERSDVLCEAVRVEEIRLLPDHALVAELVVSLDGVMVPRKDRAKDGSVVSRTGYREASAATVQLLDASGECLHVIRFARLPETRRASLARQLEAEVAALRLR